MSASGILGELAQNSAVLKLIGLVGATYFLSPIGVRALDLQYYYTLGESLSMNTAAALYSLGIGGLFIYHNNEQLQGLKL
jgi:hypothetical protein